VFSSHSMSGWGDFAGSAPTGNPTRSPTRVSTHFTTSPTTRPTTFSTKSLRARRGDSNTWFRKELRPRTGNGARGEKLDLVGNQVGKRVGNQVGKRVGFGASLSVLRDLLKPFCLNDLRKFTRIGYGHMGGVADNGGSEYISPLEMLCWLTRSGAGRGDLKRMRFHLLDRIESWEAGKTLRGLKRLTSGEEYLADHFPGFPIMPGVLQLQTLVEAGGWLLRLTDDFRDSVIALREVKSVKYGSMVRPGQVLRVNVELTARDGGLAWFKGKGETEGTQNVQAQFALAGYNLREKNPAFAARDEAMTRHWREMLNMILGQ
jgi:3-hydroxyacyl-[acyl-carrier-protein] dehydratase